MRGSLFRSPSRRVVQDVGLQEAVDEPENPAIGDLL
jgi:hypothetical protein